MPDWTFRRGMVPAELLCAVADGEITANAIVTYCVVASMQRREGDEGGVVITDDTLAAITGTTSRSVRTHLTGLQALGLAEKNFRRGKRMLVMRDKSLVKLSHIRAFNAPAPAHNAPTREKRSGASPRILPSRNGRKKISEIREREIERHVSAAKPAGNGGGFGFDKNKKSKVTGQDYDRAVNLLDAAKNHLGATHPRFKKSTALGWAEHMRLLRSADEIPGCDIDAVLQWYTANIGGQYIPQVFSAAKFRDRWWDLRAAYERNRPLPAGQEITPLAERVAGRLTPLGWPAGSASQLPGAVQASLTNYAAWRMRLVAVANDHPHPKMRRLAHHLTGTAPALGQCVFAWFTTVHGTITRAPAFSGDLRRYVWAEDAERFEATARQWVTAYCGNAKRWEALKEAMASEIE